MTMQGRTIKLVGLISALLGFVGAGMFYGPYIGLYLEGRYVCPLCPYVDGLRSNPTLTFARLTLTMGMLNTFFFFAVGSVIFLAVTGAKRVVHKAWQPLTK